jgi:hypothetical protein
VWGLYAAGALIAFWRTDAAWPTRIALGLLWPIGPLAFLVTVAILVAASLIAFPVVAGLIAVVGATAIWWVLR